MTCGPSINNHIPRVSFLPNIHDPTSPSLAQFAVISAIWQPIFAINYKPIQKLSCLFRAQLSISLITLLQPYHTQKSHKTMSTLKEALSLHFQTTGFSEHGVIRILGAEWSVSTIPLPSSPSTTGKCQSVHLCCLEMMAAMKKATRSVELDLAW